MKIVAVIPSRYGSTRFNGKPLALIAGQSMIERVYRSAASAGSVVRTVVATDDPRILDAVHGFGGEALMTAAHNRSGTDRVAEAADKLELAAEDIIINVQGDQPLVNPACFDAVIQPLLEDAELGMSTLAFEIVSANEYTHPKDCKAVMDRQGYALYFSRAPVPWAREPDAVFNAYKHLGIYAYRRWFLGIFSRLPTGNLEQIEKLEQLRALEHGHRIKVVITPFDSPEVDLPDDIARIEKMLTAPNE